jgi:hypothetical protein
VAQTTYRQIVRGVFAIFALASYFQLSGGRIFTGTRTLDTLLGDLAPAIVSKLQEAAAALNYDISGLTLASSIRDLLKALASQPAPDAMRSIVI